MWVLPPTLFCQLSSSAFSHHSLVPRQSAMSKRQKKKKNYNKYSSCDLNNFKQMSGCCGRTWSQWPHTIHVPCWVCQLSPIQQGMRERESKIKKKKGRKWGVHPLKAKRSKSQLCFTGSQSTGSQSTLNKIAKIMSSKVVLFAMCRWTHGYPCKCEDTPWKQTEPPFHHRHHRAVVLGV